MPLVVKVLVAEVLEARLVIPEALTPEVRVPKVVLAFAKVGTDVLREPLAPEVGDGRLSVSLN